MTRTVLIQRSLIVPALATLALAVVGCSGVGTTATGTTATASSLTAGSASSDVSSPLASLDPCGLLTQDQLTQLGLTLRGPDNPGKSHGCAWQKGPSYEVGIYLNPTQGIKGLNVGGSAKVVLQSHDAIQSASNGFSCVVDIAISEKSSVNVSVASPGGESQECSVAAQYATLIEPKLPAQQK